MHSSSGKNDNLNKMQEQASSGHLACYALLAGYLLELLFYPEDGCSMSLRNVVNFSPGDSIVYSRCFFVNFSRYFYRLLRAIACGKGKAIPVTCRRGP
jgi:hypothetical protein